MDVDIFYGTDIFGLISRVFIYVILGFIVYMNIITLNNYKKSKEIIVTKPKPICNYIKSKLPIISLSDLKKVPDSQGGGYLYPNSSVQPKFRVNSIENSVSYITVCNEYCKGFLDINGVCSKKSPAYSECLKQITPPNTCIGVSKPLFVSKEDGKLYFAYSISTK